MVNRVDELQLQVLDVLSTVKDPEIPPVSITDLGMVERVAVTDAALEVDLLPTFVGCPALDVIRQDVEAALAEVAGERAVRVSFVFTTPWTSDRITPEGREALRSYGLTPPGSGPSPKVFLPLASVARAGEGDGATCPFCGSEDSVLESAFGPTLCRTTHFCRSCRNPFEAFKPKLA
jgi:ring-1,2-phenylacetyl-CoA epoxidase subunit PaaD